MKTVMNNDAVAHNWAHKTQQTARNSGSTFYFEGEAIYSFGRHFIIAAHMDDGRVMWNDTSYSSRTSAQQSTVRWALTQQQREETLHVPALDEDLWNDLQRLRKSGDGKTMPKLAKRCSDGIVTAISSMSGKRYGAGPMAGLFYNAKRLEQQGLALCDYVKKGRSKPKWPLALLPDALPAKADLPAFIKKYAAVRVKEQYDRSMGEANRRMQHIREDMDDSYTHPIRVQNYLGTINAAYRQLDAAERDYKILHGKASAAVNKGRKELAVLEAWAKPKVEEFRLKIARETAVKLVREIYNKLRTRKVTGVAPYWGFAGVIKELKDLISSLPEENLCSNLIARLERISEWDAQVTKLKAARSYVQSAGDSKKAADRKRFFTQASNELDYNFTPKFLALHGDEIETLQAKATAGVKLAQEDLLKENKAILDNWLSGESNERPPYELGTYARIRGNIVETTRSATVPLEHATKLARVYRITVRRGGADWRDGAGPMVGHYRVNKIGADGSLVIGCHEFSPTEAERLAVLLDSVEESIGELK